MTFVTKNTFRFNHKDGGKDEKEEGQEAELERRPSAPDLAQGSSDAIGDAGNVLLHGCHCGGVHTAQQAPCKAQALRCRCAL